MFTLLSAVNFGIFAACLAQEFLKNGIKRRAFVKWPANGVEPKAPGLSVNRELHLVCPEVLMRSDLVFGAMTHVPNRYLLCQLASMGSRKLHRPGSRMQDTANDALRRFSLTNPIAGERAMREPLRAPLHLQRTPPALPHKSDAATFIPAREDSNPAALRLHSSGNSLTAILAFPIPPTMPR